MCWQYQEVQNNIPVTCWVVGPGAPVRIFFYQSTLFWTYCYLDHEFFVFICSYHLLLFYNWYESNVIQSNALFSIFFLSSIRIKSFGVKGSSHHCYRYKFEYFSQPIDLGKMCQCMRSSRLCRKLCMHAWLCVCVYFKCLVGCKYFSSDWIKLSTECYFSDLDDTPRNIPMHRRHYHKW